MSSPTILQSPGLFYEHELDTVLDKADLILDRYVKKLISGVGHPMMEKHTAKLIEGFNATINKINTVMLMNTAIIAITMIVISIVTIFTVRYFTKKRTKTKYKDRPYPVPVPVRQSNPSYYRNIEENSIAQDPIKPSPHKMSPSG